MPTDNKLDYGPDIDPTVNTDSNQDEALSMLAQLRANFADAEETPAQRQLLDELEQRMSAQDRVDGEGAVDQTDPSSPTPMDTLETLAAEVSATHPVAATSLREMLRILRNIGV